MTNVPSQQREPHPVREFAAAVENQASICVPRGYCGPFINRSYYDAFPDPLWWGMGDCAVCGNSCLVAREEEKRRVRLGLRRIA